MLTHDSGQNLEISFEPTFLYKRHWTCRLFVFFSKGGFLDYKNDILNILTASKVKLSYLDRLAGAFQKKRS